MKVSKANHYYQYFAINGRYLFKVLEEINEILHTK